MGGDDLTIWRCIFLFYAVLTNSIAIKRLVMESDNHKKLTVIKRMSYIQSAYLVHLKSHAACLVLTWSPMPIMCHRVTLPMI